MPTTKQITRVCNLQVNNPPAVVVNMVRGGQYDMDGSQYHPDGVLVPTAAGGELIPVGDVTSGQEGCVQFENTDQTNYAELGLVVSATFYPFAILRPGVNGQPGPPAQFDWSPSAALYWRANTAPVWCNMVLVSQ